MKLYRVFPLILALSATAVMVSCKKEVSEEEEITSTFSVEKRLITINKDGGTFNIDYSISGPKEGNVAEVSSDSPWIKIGKVFNSTFSYTAQANDTEEDREATLTMTCRGVKPLKIIISQSREKEEKPIYSNYEILVSDIGTTTARFRVTPVDAAKTYLYDVVRKADFDALTPTSYIETRIKQIKEMVAAYPGTTLSSFLSKGPVDTDNLDNRPSLFDRTDYYVTAFDLSFDEKTGAATYSGNIDKASFKTLSAPQSKMNLRINQKGDFVTITTDTSDGYVCDVLSKDAWEEFTNPDDAAHLYISTVSQYNQLVIHSGTYQIDLESEELSRGVQYVAFAVGYSDSTTNGGLTTEVTYIEFTY